MQYIIIYIGGQWNGGSFSHMTDYVEMVTFKGS